MLKRWMASAVVLALALFTPVALEAMTLSSSQLATMKADILADGTMSTIPNNPDGDVAIAALYNAAASPDYWVWRSFVPDAEMYEATSADATTWSWTIYIARSQAERDAWRQMVNMKGGIDPSLAQTRSGVADIFSGAGGLAQRTHLLALGRRTATRGEKLYASGAGTTGAPSNMAAGGEGQVTQANVAAARALP